MASIQHSTLISSRHKIWQKAVNLVDFFSNFYKENNFFLLINQHKETSDMENLHFGTTGALLSSGSVLLKSYLYRYKYYPAEKNPACWTLYSGFLSARRQNHQGARAQHGCCFCNMKVGSISNKLPNPVYFLKNDRKAYLWEAIGCSQMGRIWL